MRTFLAITVLAAIAGAVAFVALRHDAADAVAPSAASAPVAPTPVEIGAAAARDDDATPVDAAQFVRAEADVPLGDEDMLASLPPARCSGRVVDLQGAPLRGARVRFDVWRDAPDVVVLTNADGAYTSGPLAPGIYEISATLDGYVTTARSGRGIELAPDEECTVDDLELARPVKLRGRVIDDNGDPVAGAAVSASSEDAVFDRGEWNGARDEGPTTRAAADGSFALDVAPHRAWTVHAIAACADASVHVAETAEDSTVELVLPRARTIEFEVVDAANGAAMQDFACVAKGSGERAYSGPLDVLRDHDEADPADALAATATGPGRLRCVARIDAGLSFDFRAVGFDDLSTEAFAPDASIPLPYVVRLVRSAPPMRVRVVDDDRRALADVLLMLYSRTTDPDLFDFVDDAAHGVFQALARTDRDGFAAFAVRSDGPFQILVDEPVLPACRTEWIAVEDALRGVHELIVTKAAHVRGRIVLHSHPVAASLRMNFARDDGYVQQIYIGADGRYASPPLAPGRYRVRPLQDRQFRGIGLQPGQHDERDPELELRAGDDIAHDVDLALFDLGVVEGRVTANGAPLSGCSITLDTEGQAISGMDGSFTIAGVRAEHAVVRIQRAGRRMAARAIDVAPAAITRLDVDLNLTSASGHVVDAAKRPLAAARIDLTPLPPTPDSAVLNPFASATITTSTGPDGVWRVAAIECGRYLLKVSGESDALASTTNVVEIAASTGVIESRLLPFATLRVLMPATAQVDGGSASVEITRATTQWLVIDNDHVDEDGSITTAQLDPGAWIVRVHFAPAGDAAPSIREFGVVTLEPAEVRVIDATR